MTYNVYIVRQPVPETDSEAWPHVRAILERSDDEADLPACPVFLTLVERLAARHPCICDIDLDEEEPMWSDGPLRNNAKHSVVVLGLTLNRAAEGMPFVVDTANDLGLVVFDEQSGRVSRPPLPPSRYQTTCSVRIAGLRDGVGEAQAVPALAALFKRSEDDVRRLLARGNPAVKKDVSREIAAKYVAALERCGCAAAIQSDGTLDVCRRMAEAGDAEAQFDFGASFFAARGDARDCSQGMAWWLKAAAQGNANAQYNLACVYSLGEDVPKDMAEALGWAHKAADQGMPEAQFFLAYCHEGREGVAPDMDAAIDWYARAAQQGYAKAQFRMGVLVKDSLGANRGEAAALHWFRLAAAQNHALAQYNLGVMYGRGAGAAADPAKSMRWHRRAASLGCAEAQQVLDGPAAGHPAA